METLCEGWQAEGVTRGAWRWLTAGHRIPGQLGSRVFILEDIQSLPGHGPEQPALSDPALSREVGLGGLQRCPPAAARL